MTGKIIQFPNIDDNATDRVRTGFDVRLSLASWVKAELRQNAPARVIADAITRFADIIADDSEREKNKTKISVDASDSLKFNIDMKEGSQKLLTELKAHHAGRNICTDGGHCT